MQSARPGQAADKALPTLGFQHPRCPRRPPRPPRRQRSLDHCLDHVEIRPLAPCRYAVPNGPTLAPQTAYSRMNQYQMCVAIKPRAPRLDTRNFLSNLAPHACYTLPAIPRPCNRSVVVPHSSSSDPPPHLRSGSARLTAPQAPRASLVLGSYTHCWREITESAL